MSQKTEKPTLSGQRIKTRKRDEREKYDPSGFRDLILQGLNEAGSSLDAVYKFLDTAGSKLDYRRYGEVLFDILLAGGHLAPGGTIVTDFDTNKLLRTEVCVFSADDDLDSLKGYAQLITKLVRRYKYLEKTLEDEFKKVLVFLKAFSPEERTKLAKVTCILVGSGLVPSVVLISCLQDHLIKDGIALQFLLDFFKTWLLEKDAPTLWTALRKAGLETRLMEFLPTTRQTPEIFHETFENHGLSSLLDYLKAHQDTSVKKDLQQQVVPLLKNDAPMKEILSLLKDYQNKHSLLEHDLAVLVWKTLMAAVEWNKKEELVAEQAFKHLKKYSALLAAFTQSGKSELALLIKIQEFCYDNMNFMKVFRKIVFLLYKSKFEDFYC
ncbi:basic leucine zipper and W2 domain-containing protein 2-like [Limulus polyphemus]|uniref:Basic leucine zipper and W2 domain-containing protein 2-like n=1 Tax=Limulus polyphemus TaxID=6850 RepID=A0ABM1SCC0_LIMPO|nr:basic leucine zipper and W2 domain-containing protein 2-like [Limulus polyphemus]